MPSARKPYPSDASDEEWALIAPYLVLLREDAGQRLYSLRELFNGLVELRGIGARQRCGVLLYPHFSRDPFRRNLDIHEQTIAEARHYAEY